MTADRDAAAATAAAARIVETVAREVVGVSLADGGDICAILAVERTGLIVAAGLRMAAAECRVAMPDASSWLAELAEAVQAEAGRVGE